MSILRRSPTAEGRVSTRPIPAVAFLLIAGMACVVGVLVGWVVWGSAGGVTGPAKATSQAEAVKSGIAAGAAVGGLFALWIQTRRQRTEERRHSLDEQKFQAEIDVRREELTTDLYIKAIAYLGDANPSVQIGGVYALARLADTAPSEQQRIVNTLCAYLRSPFSQPDADTMAAARDHVVSTIIEVLQNGLSLTARDRWENVDIDLSGANLVELSLTNVGVRSFRFERCTFKKDLRIINCEVSESLSIQDSTIDGPFMIGGTSVGQRAWITNTEFRDHAHMVASDFARGLSVMDSKFDKDVTLDDSHFGPPDLDIRKCRFGGGVSMEDVRIDGTLKVLSSSISGEFRGANSEFRSTVRFSEDQFGDMVDMHQAVFGRDVHFDAVMFDGEVDLSETTLKGELSVDSCGYSADTFIPPLGYEVAGSNQAVVRSHPSK
ncbi:pentapeptide repeat-containing protein [Kribbella sp. NPDC002412]